MPFFPPAILALLFQGPSQTSVNASNKPAEFIKISYEDKSLKPWADRADAELHRWWPKIHSLLGLPLPKNPELVDIEIKTHGQGVAGTGGHHIEVNGDFIRQHPNDVGLIVHELAHVIQAYPRYNPSWLVEGIADYIRWFNFEPRSARPKVNPDKADYHRGYRDVGAFLDWATHKYDRNLVKKLDRALKLDIYGPSVWVGSTTKTFDELWKEFLDSKRPKA